MCSEQRRLQVGRQSRQVGRLSGATRIIVEEIGYPTLSGAPGLGVIAHNGPRTSKGDRVFRMERPALFVGDAEEGAATLNEAEVRLVLAEVAVGARGCGPCSNSIGLCPVTHAAVEHKASGQAGCRLLHVGDATLPL